MTSLEAIPSGVLLSGKVAIVTGASDGIGRAIAERFAESGASVVVADVNEDGGREVAESIGGRFVRTDVNDVTQIEETVKATVVAYGKLDILINNAGVTRFQAWSEITPEDWDFVNGVNARGTFFFLQAAAREMTTRRSGAIVNIASTAGKGYRTTSSVAYAASKGAVVTLTRTAASLFAPSNVRVNAICPGVTVTPMGKRFAELATSDYEAMVAAIPLGRPNTPRNVADVALFLASDLADTITGQSWNVDGGLLHD